ncbi:MAG: DUF6079 family protein [Myxococcota bacterium]|nr:DUF6079 family protein [Myxococcota bacterium]
MVESGNMAPTLIRDIVDVQSHPTVVRLDHLDSGNAEWITESYCLTGDVSRYITSLVHLLGAPTGKGIFLIGQYGSGKSHFLAYVAAGLRSQTLAAECPPVVPISLVNFSADMRLEKIVGQALNLAVTEQDRRLAWSEIETQFPKGLVLILDELSEFLRSKPDRRSFNEDVRFLQYMGEWAAGHRFWVLAALQEQIEHTGELEHDLYRKIKDRYPLRFVLSPAHVKDLIADSILQKKAAYDAFLGEYIATLRRGMPESHRLDEAVLSSIYPLHPATIELLEDVRDRFSQARGIVDFAVTQLGGSQERNIPPFIDRPLGDLLTPDVIVDHYADLFLVQPEFLPIAEKLLPYYERQMKILFKKDARVALANRLLKLLILFYLSPIKKGLRPDTATHLLAFAPTRIDPQRNQKIVAETLEQIAETGRYVVRRADGYHLDLEDDSGARLERLLASTLKDLEQQGEMLFEQILPSLGLKRINPFSLPRDAWQSRVTRWFSHDRTYSVYLGNADLPKRDGGVRLCIRLPWGDPRPAPGTYTVVPTQLAISRELKEAVALASIAKKPMDQDLAARVRGRLQDLLALIEAQIVNAFLGADLYSDTGKSEVVPKPRSVDNTLEEWLTDLAQWVLRRTYPSFERFAPMGGPIAHETYRSFMRFLAHGDIGEYEAEDFVKLIREAYLVPMGLLKRQGMGYVVPQSLEKNELVQRLSPLLDHTPSPKVVYEDLAEPVFGLVPDQVHLLLIFLLSLGEIDILKGNRSYRDLYETLPTPLQYDRIERTSALSAEQIRSLGTLAERFSVKSPKQWSVLAQRRVAKQVGMAIRTHMQPIERLLSKLMRAQKAPTLVSRLGKMLDAQVALDSHPDALLSLKQFLYEVGSVDLFLKDLGSIEDLPERIDRLLSELDRYEHLFIGIAQTRIEDESLQAQFAALKTAPSADDPAALETWLAEASLLYERYKTSYTARHDRFWRAFNGRPILSWQPSRLSTSRHLGLADDLAAFSSLQKEVSAKQCRKLSNLDFQPVCTCGFDGTDAPITEHLERLASLERRITQATNGYFAQQGVKKRISAWVEDGLQTTPTTLAYLDGKADLPQIDDLALLDQHLAGLDLVETIDLESVFSALKGRTWQHQDALLTIEQSLSAYNTKRLRFEMQERQEVMASTLSWCLAQSLAHGVALPPGIAGQTFERAEASLRPEGISPLALERLEQLGLSDSLVDKIVAWTFEGRIPVSPDRKYTPAITAVLEIHHPTVPDSAKHLAALASQLYRAHHRIFPIARKDWLERLDTLANWVIPDHMPTLTQVLKEREAAQWILIDALGLPLLDPLIKGIESAFPSHRLASVGFAVSPAHTVTDAFYRAMADDGIQHGFEKINCIDRLLHDRFDPFEDMVRLAQAELTAAIANIRSRIDPARDMVVFSDHGFKLATDGKTFTHGGSSALERLVPVLHLVPVGID